MFLLQTHRTHFPFSVFFFFFFPPFLFNAQVGQRNNGPCGEFNGTKFAGGEAGYEFIQMQFEVYFGFCAFSKLNIFDSINLEI